jgi:serine/threonine protein kinase
MKECPVCKRCFPDEVNHCPQDGDATAPTLIGEPTLDARYLLERRLGQGGMGVVFQARHIFRKTSHAIKVILPDLVGNDPMLATRFRQEALAAAAIRHPNIIAVTDFGMVRGTMPFLVMEFVKGRSLQEIMSQEGAMSPERAWELIRPVASGVGAAHRQNIVHRDLKPLNIMIQDGLPVAEGLKILDFGLAKIKSGELLGSFVQAQTSGLMGSPFYMAPEQWSDDEPDARADIYSLGVILYQMLAGEVPFKGSSIPSIMKKHLTLPPPTFQSMGVSVPPQLEAVVRHSLEKEVESRIDSVEAFLKELHAAMSSAPMIIEGTRETGALDPNKTMVSQMPSTTGSQTSEFSPTSATPAVTDETNFGASFDSLAGTVSSSAVNEQLKKELSDTAAAYRREKEQQERLAREASAREVEASRIAFEEAELKRRNEEERVRREQQERDTKDREQEEKFARMALQAKELEDRLERLSVSMSPATIAETDTSRTQQVSIPPETVINSFPGGQQSMQGYPVTLGRPSGKKTTPALFIVAGIVVLALAGAGVGGYLILRPKPAVVVKPPAVDKPPTPTIKAELLPIEGGTFEMGRAGGPSQERPAHPIQVQSFFMDKTEVTNAEYGDFVRETNHAPPGNWNGTKPPFGQELWPVVNVSWDDANDFALWRSKRDGKAYRLPTEEEWEYAARNGNQSDLYPWGGEWDIQNAVIKEATPAPVGSRPGGKNKWGVVDLIGNVWEWTSSKVSVYPGNPTVIPPSTKDLVTIRGACYVSDPGKLETPISSAMREFIPPTTKTTLLGFRLVRSGS